MALGDDGSCKEAGLLGSEIGSVHLNNQGWATPKLHRNERKDPSLIAGIYENNFLAPTYERNLCNGGFGSLAIPWGKINATSLSLKSLEGFIEHEKVEMKLITKKKKRLRKRTPEPETRQIPWLERRQPMRASSRQRRTERLVLASRD